MPHKLFEMTLFPSNPTQSVKYPPFILPSSAIITRSLRLPALPAHRQLSIQTAATEAADPSSLLVFAPLPAAASACPSPGSLRGAAVRPCLSSQQQITPAYYGADSVLALRHGSHPRRAQPVLLSWPPEYLHTPLSMDQLADTCPFIPVYECPATVSAAHDNPIYQSNKCA